MDKIQTLIVSFVLLFFIIGTTIASSTTIFSGNAPNTTNSSNSTNGTTTSSLSSFLNNKTIQNKMAFVSNTINTTEITQAFHTIVNPISSALEVVVVFIFALILLYGAMIILHGTSEFQVSDERKMKAMIGFVISSGMVLLLIPYMYAYLTYFPDIIKSTAPTLLSIKSPVPVYILWLDIFVSVFIALFSFLLAIKEYIRYVKSYQGVDKEEEIKEAERTQALHRVLALTAFMFLSPLVLGTIFVTLTGVFMSVSSSISSNFVSITSLAQGFKFPIYTTNYYPQCTGLNVLNPIAQVGCLLYAISEVLYGVSLQATIFNATFGLMTAQFGEVPLFMILYDIIVLFLMVYSFAKIDWYSLQYLSSLKSGEEEARNYNKLKSSYIQYIAFILSPVIFIVSLIILNALTSTIVALVMSSQMSPVPPLVNLLGQPTVEDIPLSFAGYIMSLFGIFLFVAVLILAIIRAIGGIIFAGGIFLYFSEDIKNKMFGRNLLMVFVILYMAPVIIFLLYSLFFGAVPTLISKELGYGGASAVSASVGSYSSTVLSNTNVSIKSSGSSIVVDCADSTSLQNAVDYFNGNPDGLGVLLASCQNFVGYWSNGYVIMAFVSLILIVLMIFGLPSLIGFFGSFVGISGSGFVSLTSGIHGKPKLKQFSGILKNLSSNAKTVAQIGKERTSKFIETGGKIISTGERIAYTSVTAPVQGTALGYALDTVRKGTQTLVSNIASKVRNDFRNGRRTYITQDEIEKYAKSKAYRRLGETERHAINRFKKELEERYGAKEDKYGNYEITYSNLRKLNNDYRHDFETSRFVGNPAIKQVENERDMEIQKIESAYNKKIAEAKKKNDMDAVKKLQYEKKQALDNIKREYNEKLENTAKNEHFRSYKVYKRLVNFANDIYDVTESGYFIKDYVKKAKENFIKRVKEENPDIKDEELNEKLKKEFSALDFEEKAKEIIDKKKNNIIKVLKQHGLGVAGEIELQNIIKNSPEDLANLANIAFDTMLRRGSAKIGYRMMAEAIKNRSPTIGYKVKAIVGDLGKEIKFAYLTPLVSAVSERFNNIKDMIGEFKDYEFVTGVPVYAKYDNQIREYNSSIETALRDGNEIMEKLKDESLTEDEKRELRNKLSELKDKVTRLMEEKKKLELRKSQIDHLAPVLKGFLKGTIVPSFADYIKLLSNEQSERDIGMLGVKKKLFENETRIINNNIKKYQSDLEKAKKMLSSGNLTEYQKTQVEKIINDLKAKLADLSNTKILYKNGIEDLSATLKALKAVRNNQKLQNDIYVSSAIKTKAFDQLDEMVQKDETLKKVKEELQRYDKLEGITYAVSQIYSNVEEISDEVEKAIQTGDINELDVNKIKLDKEQEEALVSIEDPEINGVAKRLSDFTQTFVKIKQNNMNEAVEKLKELYLNKNSKTVNDILQAKKETFKKNLLLTVNSQNVYDSIVKKVVDALEKGATLESAKNMFFTELDKSELSSVFKKDSPEYRELAEAFDKNFAGLRQEELVRVIASNVKNETENLQKLVSSANEKIEDRITELKREIDENLVKKFGVNDVATIQFGKLLTYSNFKQLLEETEKGKIDFKIFKDSIQQELKKKADVYDLSPEEIEKISSFDNSLFDSKQTTMKYMKFVKEDMVPIIENMKYNMVARILSEIKTAVDTGNYDVRAINELDSLSATIANSALVMMFEQYKEALTSKKPEKIGDRRSKFGWRRVSFTRERGNRIEGESQNEEDEYKSDEEQENDEVKLEPTGERRSISEFGNDKGDDENMSSDE